MSAAPWWIEIPRHPWWIAFVGDPWDSGVYRRDSWAARLACGGAVIASSLLAIARRRQDRSANEKARDDGVAPHTAQLRSGLVGAVGVAALLFLGLYFTIRPILRCQAIVAESGMAKVRIGASFQFETVHETAAWLPWTVSLSVLLLTLSRTWRSQYQAWWVLSACTFTLPCLWLGYAVRELSAAGMATPEIGPFPADLAQRIGPYLQAREHLERAWHVFVGGVSGATLLAGTALWLSCRRSRGADGLPTWHPPAPSWRVAGTWLAICLASSLFLSWMTGPIARENRVPVPMDHCFVNIGLGFLPPPATAGVGPDALEEGPSVEYRDGWSLDSSRLRSPDELRTVLRTKREWWKATHPGRAFPGTALLSLTTPLSSGRLREALLAVLRAGYPEVRFRLTEMVEIERPFLDVRTGARETAVRALLANQKAECGTEPFEEIPLEIPPTRTADELVLSLIPLRTAGKLPCLLLPDDFTCPYDESICLDALDAFPTVMRESPSSLSISARRLQLGNLEYDVVTVEDSSTIRVLYTGSDGRALETLSRLRTDLEEHGLQVVMAMNAGMYHPSRRPVGYTVQKGKLLQRLDLDEGEGNFFLKPNGVLLVQESGARVLESRAWAAMAREASSSDPVREATQSGPLLLDGGRLHRALSPNSNHRAIRNGVGITPKGKVVFAISNVPVSLYELAQLFTVLGANQALYLDGNVSSMDLPCFSRYVPNMQLGPMLAVVRAEPLDGGATRQDAGSSPGGGR